MQDVEAGMARMSERFRENGGAIYPPARRTSRAALSAALAALLAAACAPNDPAYPPPTQEEARAAFVRALRTDWIDSTPPERPSGPTAIGPGDTPETAGNKAASALSYESAMTTRATVRENFKTLGKLTLGACEWSELDAGEVKFRSRERAGTATHAWLCAYEVFHDTAIRGRVRAKGRGYFFHREGAYDFAEVEEGTFEEVRD